MAGQVGAEKARLFDRISIAMGKCAAWLTLVMVIITFIVVVMRYVFDAGFIWLQESVIWMHAFVFMIGAAYTLQQDGHVRVDIFYRRKNEGGRAWIDLLGVALLLMPFCLFLAWTAFDYVAASWALREASRESGGLPYPFIPLLKSLLVAMPIMLSLQGITIALRAIRTLRDQ